jgi:hypothetical protein
LGNTQKFFGKIFLTNKKNPLGRIFGKHIKKVFGKFWEKSITYFGKNVLSYVLEKNLTVVLGVVLLV